MNVSSSIRLASFCFLFLLTIHPAMARMYSSNCHAFIVRRNHIHHTGLNTSRPTEGEGMYIGCHDGSCRTTDSIFEGNYIHHTRGTSDGGNDGIEIKFGSSGNIVGAYEADHHEQNIDWRIEPGFRKTNGSSSASAFAAEWRVADQPNLKQELENAPILKAE